MRRVAAALVATSPLSLLQQIGLAPAPGEAPPPQPVAEATT
jgi:hypothetical protein